VFANTHTGTFVCCPNAFGGRDLPSRWATPSKSRSGCAARKCRVRPRGARPSRP